MVDPQTVELEHSENSDVAAFHVIDERETEETQINVREIPGE